MTTSNINTIQSREPLPDEDEGLLTLLTLSLLSITGVVLVMAAVVAVTVTLMLVRFDGVENPAGVVTLSTVLPAARGSNSVCL